MFQKGMKYKSDCKLAIVLAAMLCICLVGYAYPQGMNQSTSSTDQGSTQQPSSTTDQRQSTASGPTSVAAGQKMEVEGVILKRSGEGFTMLDERGQNINVLLTNNTEVKERKTNPFRRAKNYATTQLLRGLQVEVKGRADSNGNLAANEIKLKNDDYKVATSVESRVSPVEGRLGEAETRLGQSEQNAQRLSGQVEELTTISNAARGGAKAAQEAADKAQDSANQANSGVRTANERISSLDDFDVRTTTTVHFKVGSAVPSKEAKADLDKIADEAKNEKGYVIEVAGFASADGSEALNRRLSQRRADAVIQYLAENHDIPLRRIVTPFGYGEKQPVADNKTRTGRQQNRRVEVRILVNKGLIQSASAEGSTQQSSSTQGQPAER